MWELEAALARPPRDPAVATGGGGEGEPVTLLPVLVGGLRVEDLGDAQNRLYGPGAWPSSRERPPDDVPTAWAALLKRVASIVCVREDQARGLRAGLYVACKLSGMQDRGRGTPGAWRAACCSCDGCRHHEAPFACGLHAPLLRRPPHPGTQARGFQGGLALQVAELCVKGLKSSGHLPQSHGSTAGAPPMQLPRPPCVVGRGADMDAVRKGLREKRCVLLTGGPGEGKSTLACAVGAALWDEGAYQRGAFELDMTGGQRAPVACGGVVLGPPDNVVTLLRVLPTEMTASLGCSARLQARITPAAPPIGVTNRHCSCTPCPTPRRSGRPVSSGKRRRRAAN
jgi:hypothetical protein